MPKATGKEAQDNVLALRDEGKSYDDIAEAVGLPKSTVRNIVKRAKDGANRVDKGAKKSANKADREIPARAHVIQDDRSDVGTDIGTESALDALTRERSARELMSYIAVAKKGYIEARKSKQDPDKKTWQEVQYLKLYKDGIRMLIDCTGLSRDAVLSVPTSPVDDYLEKALDMLKEEQ